MRTFLLETTLQAVEQCDFVLVGGLTGTGKTDVLLQLDNVLDLEGHANHRGSSFGKRATAQPAQIDFENQLAIDILKSAPEECSSSFWRMKGASSGVARCPELYRGMQQYPLVWLEDSFENRVERILRDYVINLCAEFVALHGEEDGRRLFAERMLQSMGNIHKRLGGERFQRLSALLGQAWTSSCAVARWICTGAGSKGCSTNTTTRCMPTNAKPRQSVSSLPATGSRCANTSRPGPNASHASRPEPCPA